MRTTRGRGRGGVASRGRCGGAPIVWRHVAVVGAVGRLVSIEAGAALAVATNIAAPGLAIEEALQKGQNGRGMTRLPHTRYLIRDALELHLGDRLKGQPARLINHKDVNPGRHKKS